jgi:hypothetical protein
MRFFVKGGSGNEKSESEASWRKSRWLINDRRRSSRRRHLTYHRPPRMIAIVGYGKVGRLHAQVLSKEGHFLIIVDPLRSHSFWPSFRDLREIPPSFVEQIRLWVVSTPTELHLPVLESLFPRQVGARVLLEKPAVLPGEFELFAALHNRFPQSRLAVHDTYGFSPVIDGMIAHLKVDPRADKLDSIAIEMSKNRLRDEQNGRFTDLQWGAAGYEGFHLLSVKRRLIGAFPSSRPHVHLLTSSEGILSLSPELLRDVFSHDGKKMILRRQIDYDSEFRYRLVKGKFASGLKFELAFEPLFGQPGVDYKNVHCFALGDDRHVQFNWFWGNHFAFALKRQISTLLSTGSTWPNDIKSSHRLEEIEVRGSEKEPAQRAAL